MQHAAKPEYRYKLKASSAHPSQPISSKRKPNKASTVGSNRILMKKIKKNFVGSLAVSVATAVAKPINIFGFMWNVRCSLHAKFQQKRMTTEWSIKPTLHLRHSQLTIKLVRDNASMCLAQYYYHFSNAAKSQCSSSGGGGVQMVEFIS